MGSCSEERYSLDRNPIQAPCSPSRPTGRNRCRHCRDSANQRCIVQSPQEGRRETRQDAGKYAWWGLGKVGSGEPLIRQNLIIQSCPWSASRIPGYPKPFEARVCSLSSLWRCSSLSDRRLGGARPTLMVRCRFHDAMRPRPTKEERVMEGWRKMGWLELLACGTKRSAVELKTGINARRQRNSHRSNGT